MMTPPGPSNRIMKKSAGSCPFCHTDNLMPANRATRRATKGQATGVLVHKPGCVREPHPRGNWKSDKGDRPGVV